MFWLAFKYLRTASGLTRFLFNPVLVKIQARTSLRTTFLESRKNININSINDTQPTIPRFLDSLRGGANARNVSFRISLRWPIHIINPVDKTKLSRYTSQRRSTTVSLETYPLYFLVDRVKLNKLPYYYHIFRLI